MLFKTTISSFIFAFSAFAWANTEYNSNDIYSVNDLKSIETTFAEVTQIGVQNIEKVFSTSKENIVIFKINADSIQQIGAQYLTYFVDHQMVAIEPLIDFSRSQPAEFGVNIRRSENISELTKYYNSDIDVLKSIDYPAYGEKLAEIYVFTDTSCPFCERFFGEVELFQMAGISVNHIYYPRAYDSSRSFNEQPQAFYDLANLACSDNPEELLNDFFTDNTDPVVAFESEERAQQCYQQVKAGFEFGELVGVSGTPATLLPNGDLLPGARSAQNMIPYILSIVD